MEKEIIELLKEVDGEEIPVVAVVVCNGEMISWGLNTVEKTKNILGHAEINAIIKAVEKKKDWRLDDCELYCTLEPCKMCEEVIKRARITKVYYYLKNDKKNISKTKFMYKQNLKIESEMLKKMKDLFLKIRDKDS